MSMTISGSTNINVPAAAKQAGRQQKTQSGFAGQVLKCVQAGGQKVLLCQDALMSYASPQTGESVNIYRSKNYSADNPVYLLKGLDKDGREFEQEIHAQEIDPHNCSYNELMVLITCMPWQRGIKPESRAFFRIKTLPPASGQ